MCLITESPKTFTRLFVRLGIRSKPGKVSVDVARRITETVKVTDAGWRMLEAGGMDSNQAVTGNPAPDGGCSSS